MTHDPIFRMGWALCADLETFNRLAPGEAAGAGGEEGEGGSIGTERGGL